MHSAYTVKKSVVKSWDDAAVGGCARLPPMCTGLISSLLFVLVPAPGFFLRFSSLHKNQHFLNCDAIWKQWMRSHFMEMPLQIPIYLIIINFSIFNRPLPARTSLLYPCMLRILSFKALNLISPCRFPVSRVNRAQKKSTVQLSGTSGFSFLASNFSFLLAWWASWESGKSSTCAS